jgi:hypothetical protein
MQVKQIENGNVRGYVANGTPVGTKLRKTMSLKSDYNFDRSCSVFRRETDLRLPAEDVLGCGGAPGSAAELRPDFARCIRRGCGKNVTRAMNGPRAKKIRKQAVIAPAKVVFRRLGSRLCDSEWEQPGRE